MRCVCYIRIARNNLVSFESAKSFDMSVLDINEVATHKQPVEAKYTKHLMVSGPEGKIQSKILKNVKVLFWDSRLYLRRL